jgi:DNA-binding transcriptional MerR regulator
MDNNSRVGAARAPRKPVSKIEEPPRVEIPNKLYFRIGDVSRLAGVKPYVLRFWESEFPGLAPRKSGTGHRLYRRKEVELVLEIRRLLYDNRFTIEGARKALEAKGLSEPLAPPSMADQASLFGSPKDAIAEIRKELGEILQLLG